MPLKTHMHTRVLSLLDQVFFSAGNFVLVILLARHFSAIEVAGYGIGLSIALIIQSVQRTCYVVQNAVLPSSIFILRARRVLAQHLVMWAWILAVELAVGAVIVSIFPDAYTKAIIMSAIVCSLIYGQLDFERITLTKSGRIQEAFFASAIFLALCLVLFFTVSDAGISYELLMLIIAIYAVGKIARIVVLTGKPDWHIGVRLAQSSLRRYFASSVMGVIGYSGHYHAPLFILSAVAAPAHSAAFVAIRGLMQPLMVIIRSLDVVDKSLLPASSGIDGLHTVMLRQLRVYGLLSLLAVSVSYVIAEPLVHFTYSGSYDDYAGLLTGWAIIFSMFAIVLPLETVITRLGRLRQYNSWRLGAGAVGFITALLFCPTMGAQGAILACIAGWLCCLAIAGFIVKDAICFKQKPRRLL